MKRQDLPPRNRWTALPYIQPAVRRPRPKLSPGLSAAEHKCTMSACPRNPASGHTRLRNRDCARMGPSNSGLGPRVRRKYYKNLLTVLDRISKHRDGRTIDLRVCLHHERSPQQSRHVCLDRFMGDN